jgi:hypothetical protein
MKTELYDKMCRLLTEYEELTQFERRDFADEFYDLLVEIQNSVDIQPKI